MFKKLLDGTITRILLASGAVLGLIVGIISAGTLALISTTLSGDNKKTGRKKLASRSR